jgi:hypothetical protein
MNLGCEQDEGPVWVRFNSSDDVIPLDVTVDDVPAEAASYDLRSTTGATIVGTVELSPSSGPVGTQHRILVSLDPVYEERVQRVDFMADSGSRGSLRFSMGQDSADLFKWVLDLTSMGVEGETRTDTLSFELFEVQEATLPGDTDFAVGATRE